MRSIQEFDAHVRFVLSDIDDTMTDEGRLEPEAYTALWDLHRAGLHVIPVTGRPAGWCEMIARQWPVAGVIGENGGFYFRYNNKKMKRSFAFDFETQIENRKRLDMVQERILAKVPGAALASDQFCRLMDLAIDFCEDVPALDASSVKMIKTLFEESGAKAKISSIHVNGWYGDYDKASCAFQFLADEFGLNSDQAKDQCIYVGDSPNDEPLWAAFPHGFAVANIQKFWSQIQNKPKYVASKTGGAGFAEIARHLLKTHQG